MTKTTNRNNEFQAVLMEMMRNNGMTSNSPLVLTEMPGTGEIIIGKKQYFPPAPKVSAEPNHTNYIFRNRYDGENPNFVSLTDEQERLLKYLEDYCCLSSDWDFDEVNSCTFEKI